MDERNSVRSGGPQVSLEDMLAALDMDVTEPVCPSCGGRCWTDGTVTVCRDCGAAPRTPQPELSPQDRYAARRRLDEQAEQW